jgi:PIN domain nuclease of toxin-antitoxin system
MKYLLDTHYLIWSIADSKKLSKKVREIIVNPDHQVKVSVVSFWEISLKVSLGKLVIKGLLPETVPALCNRIGFEIELLSPKDSSTYHLLNMKYHKDLFDRMLIWQAIANNYTLISSDDDVKKYVSGGLKILTS